MHMNIEESGSDDEPGCIEDRDVRGQSTARSNANGLNLAAANDDVGNGVDFPCRIDEPPISHDEIHQPPNSRNRTAIRTATPADT